MIAQPWEYAKKHWNIHFKLETIMVCEISQLKKYICMYLRSRITGTRNKNYYWLTIQAKNCAML